MARKDHVWVIDDDRSIRWVLERALQREQLWRAEELARPQLERLSVVIVEHREQRCAPCVPHDGIHDAAHVLGAARVPVGFGGAQHGAQLGGAAVATASWRNSAPFMEAGRRCRILIP